MPSWNTELSAVVGQENKGYTLDKVLLRPASCYCGERTISVTENACSCALFIVRNRSTVSSQ